MSVFKITEIACIDVVLRASCNKSDEQMFKAVMDQTYWPAFKKTVSFFAAAETMTQKLSMEDLHLVEA